MRGTVGDVVEGASEEFPPKTLMLEKTLARSTDGGGHRRTRPARDARDACSDDRAIGMSDSAGSARRQASGTMTHAR